MKSRIDSVIGAVTVTALIVLSWISAAVLTGVFFGIARRAYNWVV